jgi:hypothetical protein
MFFHFEPGEQHNVTSPASAPWREALESPSEVLSHIEPVGVLPPPQPDQPKQEFPVSPVCHVAARNDDLYTVSLFADVTSEGQLLYPLE